MTGRMCFVTPLSAGQGAIELLQRSIDLRPPVLLGRDVPRELGLFGLQSLEVRTSLGQLPFHPLELLFDIRRNGPHGQGSVKTLPGRGSGGL